MYERLKEARDSIKCCFKLNDTDIDCLFVLLDLNRPVTANELSKIMNLSKTSIENSLKRLIEVGLVVRNKSDYKKIGRPKYYYSVVDKIIDKIKVELENCSKRIQLSLL